MGLGLTGDCVRNESRNDDGTSSCMPRPSVVTRVPQDGIKLACPQCVYGASAAELYFQPLSLGPRIVDTGLRCQQHRA